jgi:hypothetical protein
VGDLAAADRHRQDGDFALLPGASMHRRFIRSRSTSALAGVLFVATHSATAQVPGVQLPPDVQLPPGHAQPGAVPPAGAAGQSIVNLVDGFFPGETVYVAVDALPVFDGEKLLDERLVKGARVTIAETDPAKNSIFLNRVDYGVGAPKFGFVSRLGLTRNKPAKLDAPPPPKRAGETPQPDPAEDAERLEGTWAVAGMVVMGRVNPSISAVIPIKELGNLIPGGGALNQPGDMMLSLVSPNSEYYRFEGSKVTAWNAMTLVDAERKNPQHQFMGEIEQTFRLNPKVNPRRLDLSLLPVGRRFQPTTVGIYRWDRELLVWAFPSTLGGLGAWRCRDSATPSLPVQGDFSPSTSVR